MEFVLISNQVRDVLKAMSEETNQSVQDIVAKAVEKYRRELFLAKTNEAYARLVADPVQKAEHEAELKEWDCTLMDGLDEQWNEEGGSVVERG